MTYFNWAPELDTGISVIDSQHKRIVEYINLLDNAVREKDMSVVAEVVDQLTDYTVTHFTFEEELMQKHGYPYLDAHKKVHQAFTERVKNYKERIDQGEDVSRQLLSDLRIWLTNHIKRDDKDYVEICNKVDHGWVSKAVSRLFGT